MESAELIDRLRHESGFHALPLLGNTGTVAGLHLTRFLPGGYLDVVQAWGVKWAVFARLHNTLDSAAPFETAPQVKGVSGTLAEIAAPLLSLTPTPRHVLEANADNNNMLAG
ncbi:hypothetical protein ACQPZF_03675 [Actinosynnema sp. CS-041913]|uniref:hypothetical protein n=1 Tax=Actinosynnema sp. CS-041913 TaxID=3239917 RepID=UPI003D94AB8B